MIGNIVEMDEESVRIFLQSIVLYGKRENEISKQKYEEIISELKLRSIILIICRNTL